MPYTKAIRLWVFLALLWLMWLGLPAYPALADAQKEFPLLAKVAFDGAKLLSSPSYESKVVRTANRDEELVIVQRVRTFFLVKDEVTSSFLFIDEFAVNFVGKVPQAQKKRRYLRDDIMRLGLSHPDLQFFRGGRISRGGDIPYDGYAKGKSYPTYYLENASYIPSADGLLALREAQKYLGMPYRLGGNGQGGIDCSGLVTVAFAKQGINLPRRACLQGQIGKMVSRSELQVGDLVFFRDNTDPGFLSHVGIYAGGGRFIHASSSIGKVAYSSLSEPYYSSHFAFGRRL